MYTIDDIDVFIMTHNRSIYLTETIECFLRQTVRPKFFTVLDNESTDDTEQIVTGYKNQGVKYFKTYSRPGNFLKGKELASKEFSVLCHDDNLIHPQFFERMLLGLNAVKDVAGIACSYDFFSSDASDIKDPVKDMEKNLGSSTELNKSFLIYENWMDFCRNNILAETYPWPKTSPASPVLIYKTDILKHRTDMVPVYGKADDLFLYKTILQHGKFVLLQDPRALLIRQHKLRDFYTDDNSLSLEQCVNWISIYTEEMNKNTCGDLWLRFWEMVYYLYPILAKKTLTAERDYKNFCAYLIEKGIVSDEGKRFYSLFPKKLQEIQKLLSLSAPVANKKVSFIEKLFSVRNERNPNGKKRKILRLFGLKICLGVKKRKDHV